ncbi:Sec-independent protein translocase protein TatB [Chitinimonas koreensis]|uniref:Sec-independent protein translocase protein TatB n=1 Tax=Chitinimonas koreensis TaxID=356302 RepID=UPI000416872C|nr:Sec-independent protein translocase protein TatB [Chitinimonas koreensis]QNM96298.1 twin-arginine translocase subunit TatB [Chitinimonas koreensis]
MFDISFGELLIIGAVALVVIGPERLPKVARTVGALVGRLQRYVAGVKADIQREIEIDSLRKLEAEMNEAGRKIGAEITSGFDPMRQAVQETGEAAREALSEPPAHSESVAGEAAAAPADSAAAVAAPVDDKQFDLFTRPPLETEPVTLPVIHPPERDRR